MASRESEIRQVAATLDGLLDELADSVAALNSLLVPAAEPAPPDDTTERMVTP